MLRDAIQCGLDNRAEALEYALQFGRGIDAAVADRFVSMYVNELTQDYGDEGRKAVTELLRRGRGARRIPRARPDRLRPLTSRACRARSSSPRFARPIGRYGGALSGVRPDDLAGIAIAAAVERAGVDGAAIDDVYFGCANQAGEDNRNVARMGALLAGLPDSVAGVTLNRLCASGLSAVVSACHAVLAGDAEVVVAGGVESMSRAPLVTGEARRGVPAREPDACGTRRSAGASRTHGSRSCSRSSRWARRARTSPSAGTCRARTRTRSRSARRSAGPPPTRPGASTTSSSPSATSRVDEHPRPQTTPTALAGLKPAFRADGTVTAGNASGINDGAAALVIASEEQGARARRRAARRVRRLGGRGCRPARHGHRADPGGAEAARARGHRTSTQLDLVELNEAFASQSLAVIRELGLDEEKVNVNGGAIALGHPLGMSGARLVVSLLHELRRRDGRYGLATLCVGVGQGVAALFER